MKHGNTPTRQLAMAVYQYCFSSKRHVTDIELVEEFGMSVKTARRYLRDYRSIDKDSYIQDYKKYRATTYGDLKPVVGERDKKNITKRNARPSVPDDLVYKTYCEAFK